MEFYLPLNESNKPGFFFTSNSMKHSQIITIESGKSHEIKIKKVNSKDSKILFVFLVKFNIETELGGRGTFINIPI